MRTFWFTVALVTVAFAGCLDGNVAATDTDGDGISDADEIARGTDPFDPNDGSLAPSPYAQVVVAVIDTGVNVYHDFYQRNESIPDHVLATFTNTLDDQPPRRVHLTQEGEYEERLEADLETWNNISQQELIYFEGTNVLGISFAPPSEGSEDGLFGGSDPTHPILDDGSHGTGTTTSVLIANPDAIVVLVEGTGNDDGEQWAATQPWIDLLSESYGFTCGQPALELVSEQSTARNNMIAADNGKLVVGAADNTPCPANNDGTSGPPWVVGVAGSHPEDGAQCREVISGNIPDFVADFTQNLSRAGTTNETVTMSGTSFATPTTAGTLSAILQRVRTDWGHTGGIMDGAMAVAPDGQRLTAGALREALNRTAVYFDADPGCAERRSTPVAPEAPWLQMGWGHVGPEAIDPAVDYLLGDADPLKPAEAVRFMEANYQYRQEIWSRFIE